MRNAMRARRGLAAVAVLGAACLPISTLNRSRPDGGRLASTNTRSLAAASTQSNSLCGSGGRTIRRTRPVAMSITLALSSSSTANR